MLIFLCLYIVIGAPPADLVDPSTYTQFNIPYDGDWYSGYLDIYDDNTKQLHYFFFPSKIDQSPIILWLNGGPGCSSLTGAFLENGPFLFESGTINFRQNEFGWTKLAHMLYLEAPAGVGFSIGDPKTDDKLQAEDNLLALHKFYLKFPELKDRELYIAGESYAGIYIPTLINEILDYNDVSNDNKINIRGMMIGNGCTDPTECTVEAKKFPYHKFEFLFNHNFISDALFEEAKSHRYTCFDNDSQECQDLYQRILDETNMDGQLEYNPYNVYGKCYQPPIILNDGSQLQYSSDPDETLKGHISPCADALGQYYYFRNQEFMKAIHIKNESQPWDRCQELEYTKDPRATYYLYPKIISKGVKILKFSGDVDGVVPITGSLYWIEKLQNEYHLPTLENWRPWYKSDEQNAGNVLIIDGLWFVSIRNAGHMVPSDQAEASFIMVNSFLNDIPLPLS